MNIKEIDKDKYLTYEKMFSVHPLQSYAWGELKKPNWQPLRIEISKEEEAISIVTILTRNIPIVGKRFGYIPRGIFVKESKDFKEVLEELKSYSNEVGLTHLMIDPDINFNRSKNGLNGRLPIEEALISSGFKECGDQIQPNRTVILDLSKSEEELLADMRSKHRQYIRKSERNGIRIRQGGKSDIDAFCSIIKDISKQRGYLLHDSDYYKKVWKEFGQNTVLFIAEKGKEVLGSYFLLLSSKNAYEMYGGCNRDGNKLLANYLLKWTAIRHCKKIGKRFYDQWGAEFKYPGLVQFKEGFGGKIIEYPKQYVYINKSVGWNVYKVFEKVNRLRQSI